MYECMEDKCTGEFHQAVSHSALLHPGSHHKWQLLLIWCALGSVCISAFQHACIHVCMHVRIHAYMELLFKDTYLFWFIAKISES